ncbi:hypothetical protein CALCODRAFT_372411 [Calocera cornea HHB12733]|uniref:Uncharacterized protein n=1 Tax=Calocera cornea HHB12733 TaxID=1353952 RepID=A0A165EGT2_9BASI|nr:hypothetical protein CALCODRAFT_372411 [Calocera cornea HHB12733]
MEGNYSSAHVSLRSVRHQRRSVQVCPASCQLRLRYWFLRISYPSFSIRNIVNSSKLDVTFVVALAHNLVSFKALHLSHREIASSPYNVHRLCAHSTSTSIRVPLSNPSLSPCNVSKGSDVWRACNGAELIRRSLVTWNRCTSPNIIFPDVFISCRNWRDIIAYVYSGINTRLFSICAV